jgi:hypothetical protein
VYPRELSVEREARREGDRLLHLQVEELGAKVAGLTTTVLALTEHVRLGGEGVTKLREHTDRRLTMIGAILLAMLAGQHPELWAKVGELVARLL